MTLTFPALGVNDVYLQAGIWKTRRTDIWLTEAPREGRDQSNLIYIQERLHRRGHSFLKRVTIQA